MSLRRLIRSSSEGNSNPSAFFVMKHFVSGTSFYSPDDLINYQKLRSIALENQTMCAVLP